MPEEAVGAAYALECLPRKHEFKPSFPQKKFKKGNKP
jgi:hypothetical protein